MSEAFESIASDLDYPMFIVTAAGRGEREGCLHLSWEEGVRCSLERPLARLVGGLDVI